MKLFRRNVLPMAVGLMLSALSMGLLAQDGDSQKDKEKSRGAMTSMTGCLTKDVSGGYVLTDEATGARTPVSGVSDLEKHSANHKVTLTGMSKTDASGTQVFEATKLKHVSNSCKASPQ